jgi:ferredoxin-NADP reductase
VTLIAGGIGIAPIRALLESLPARPGDLTLVFRASHHDDLVFRRELDLLADRRGARVHYVVGHRRGNPVLDPLDTRAIVRLVPDIAAHDVYLCGPNGFMDSVEHHLRDLGVPAQHVHAERFAY